MLLRSTSLCIYLSSVFFFFNDTATTEIYTLSLHDALPICHAAVEQRLQRGAHLVRGHPVVGRARIFLVGRADVGAVLDACHVGRVGPGRSEEHTLNSSHLVISYAVFCLTTKITQPPGG